jgi:hypothetical protein
MLCKLNYWPLLTKISQKDFKHTIVDTPHYPSSFIILSLSSLLKQLTEVRLLEGLRLTALKQDGHTGLRGSGHRSVMPYIHERIRVILLRVMFNSRVELA